MVFTLALGSMAIRKTDIDLGNGVKITTDLSQAVLVVKCLYPVDIAVRSDEYNIIEYSDLGIDPKSLKDSDKSQAITSSGSLEEGNTFRLVFTNEGTVRLSLTKTVI